MRSSSHVGIADLLALAALVAVALVYVARWPVPAAPESFGACIAEDFTDMGIADCGRHFSVDHSDLQGG